MFSKATRRLTLALAGMLIGLACVGHAVAAEPQIGQKAPDFVINDTYGRRVQLSAFLGKPVVLEWTNDTCPFVRAHYGSGSMQALQRRYTDPGAGVVWLSIISSAPGNEGYVDAEKANELTKSRGAAPSSVLLDPTGTLGHLYGAKTTPHMFVIDRAGILIYAGAIDDKPTGVAADALSAHNYVADALDAVLQGRPVLTPATRSYGCSVKYDTNS